MYKNLLVLHDANKMWTLSLSVIMMLIFCMSFTLFATAAAQYVTFAPVMLRANVYGITNSTGDNIVLSYTLHNITLTKLINTTAQKPYRGSITWLVQFSDLTAKRGDEFEICVMTLKDTRLLCGNGHIPSNSLTLFLNMSKPVMTNYS
jgi:hypothetical protein